MTTTTAFAQIQQSASSSSSARRDEVRAFDGPSIALALGAIASVGFAAVSTIVLAVLL